MDAKLLKDRLLVKSLTVLGKFCLILICNSSQAQSWQNGYTGWTQSRSIGDFVYGMNKHLSDGLDRSDTVAHTKAVYFALNNLQTGEVAEWYNDTNSSHGKAQIKMTWTASGEVCRMIYSYVITRRNSFTYEDKACYNNARHTWNFVDKY